MIIFQPTLKPILIYFIRNKKWKNVIEILSLVYGTIGKPLIISLSTFLKETVLLEVYAKGGHTQKKWLFSGRTTNVLVPRHTHKHTNTTLTQTHTHKHSFTQTHVHTHPLTQTDTHPHTHTHTNTHTHPLKMMYEV